MKNNTIKQIKFLMLSVFATLIIFPFSAIAVSPGALDKSFSNEGVLGRNCSNPCDIHDTAVAANGDVIAVGRADRGSGGGAFDFYVVVHSSGGQLSEELLIDINGTIDAAFSVDVGADGKIYIAGSADPVGLATSDFAVVRLNSDYTLDTTFSGDGKVITDFSGGNDFGRSIDVVGTNQNPVVFVGGAVIIAGNRNFGFAKYLNDGSLDPSFGGDGKVDVDFNGIDELRSIEVVNLQVNAVGDTANNFAFCKLLDNGNLDTTFDTDGKVITNIGAGDSAKVIERFNADIYVAGTDGTASVVVKYNSNGSLDTTFDGDGIAVYDFVPGIGESVEDMVLTTTSSFPTLAVRSNTGQGLRVARIKTDGSRDGSFGFNNGVATFSGNGIFTENTVAIARTNESIVLDRKIYLLGQIGNTYAISRSVLKPQPSPSSDFDGDSFPDIAVFRPSTGNWFVLRSIDNTFQSFTFGLNGDIPLNGDFDGDGKTDLSIYRPSDGVWFFQRSSDGTTLGATFGTSTDKPVPADYDKDGKSDITVFRPSTGEWLVLRSSDNFASFFGFPFGQNGDIPITKIGQ